MCTFIIPNVNRNTILYIVASPSNEVSQFAQEVQTLINMRHPNVVTLSFSLFSFSPLALIHAFLGMLLLLFLLLSLLSLFFLASLSPNVVLPLALQFFYFCILPYIKT